MDHVLLGQQLTHFRSPPANPSLETIEEFSDGLKDVLNDKIKAISEALDGLETFHEEVKTTIGAVKISDPFLTYFWLLYLNCLYEEKNYMMQWLRYWLYLAEIVFNVKNPLRVEFEKNHLNEETVDAARKFPLQHLYAGKLHHQGQRWLGKCPFHEENTPSFVIFPDNRFYCFGCQACGDSIQFVMKLQNYSFIDAVRSLQ